MVLNIDLINVGIKPIFTVVVPGMEKPIKVLFDTGSTKVIWCSAVKDIKDFHFQDTHETTTLSGFGTGEQEGCKIYKGDFSIYRAGRGITFKDVEIVESTKKIAAFDLLLPYALFHEFEYTFKPASPVATCQGHIHHFSSLFLGLPCFPCSKSWRMTRFSLSSTFWVLVSEKCISTKYLVFSIF